MLWIGSVLAYWIKISFNVRYNSTRPLHILILRIQLCKCFLRLGISAGDWFWILSFMRRMRGCIRGALQVGKHMSRAMLLLTAISAVLPLGVNGCKGLRKLLLDDPLAVDDLIQALAVLERRVAIMHDLTATTQTASSSEGDSQRVLGEDEDLQSEAEGARSGTPLSQVGSGSDDLVHVSRSDWESPVARRVALTLLGVDDIEGHGNGHLVESTVGGEGESSMAEASPGGALVSVGSDAQRGEEAAVLLADTDATW
jgi:hypothetical protein